MTRPIEILIQEGGPNIVCEATGRHKNGKFAGWITLMDGGRHHISPLVRSEPIYDSREEARLAMEGVVAQVRSPQKILQEMHA